MRPQPNFIELNQMQRNKIGTLSRNLVLGQPKFNFGQPKFDQARLKFSTELEKLSTKLKKAQPKFNKCKTNQQTYSLEFKTTNDQT